MWLKEGVGNCFGFALSQRPSFSFPIIIRVPFQAFQTQCLEWNVANNFCDMRSGSSSWAVSVEIDERV